MKIDNFLFLNKYCISNNKDLINFFKKGTLFKGEIIDILNNNVILDIGNNILIRAKSNNIDNMLKGEVVNFIVKNITSDKLEISPCFKSEQSNQQSKVSLNQESYITKILNEYGIKQDYISKELIKNLIKFNIPLNKKNIVKLIKIIDNLMDFSRKVDNKKIILLNDNKKPCKSDVSNFIMVNKDDFPQKQDFTILFDDIQHQLSSQSYDKITLSFIKSVVFLMKNNMKISPNNIKNVLSILNGNNTLDEDLKELSKYFVKNNFKNELKNINIKFNQNDKIMIKNYCKYLNKKIEIINHLIKDGNIKVNDKFEKIIETLNNKLEFFNEINKNMTFIYIPVRINNRECNDIISLLNKRRNKGNSYNKIDIFINLNMDYLGTVKILCNIIDKVINIKFNIDKINIPFFINQEQSLKTLLKEKGFKLNNISYYTDKNIDLYNILVDNDKPFYYLDMKV